MSVCDGPKSNRPNSADQRVAPNASARHERSIRASLRDLTLRRDDVGEQFVARDVEQKQLQVFVELEARDQPLHTAPCRFERLE